MSLSYSLVLNSRWNTWLLEHMLDSVWETASNPNRVSITINIDEDDIESIAFSKSRPEKFIIEGRHPNLNNKLNKACLETPADIYWGLNSDICFKTYGWDDIIEYKVKDKKIFSIYCNDGIAYGTEKYDGKEFNCFPIISHKLFEALTCLIPHENERAAGDVWLDKIIRNVKQNIIIWANEIEIIHYKYLFNINPIMKYDNFNCNYRTLDSRADFNNYIKRVNNAIDQYC